MSAFKPYSMTLPDYHNIRFVFVILGHLNIDVPYVYCNLDLVLKNGRLSLREDKHILLRYVQHVPHLRPGEDEGFKFAYLDGDFPFDALSDLGDEAALVVGDLAFIGFVGPVVLHVAWPEAAVDLVTGYDLLRLSRQDQQVLEAGRILSPRFHSIARE